MVRLLSLLGSSLALFGAALALKNPLIPGWNPDPHVIRVEDTYYVAVSSFLTFPAVPIYKSKDLSSWELVSHAIDSPFKVPLVGVKQQNGIWAPSLSYMNGRFYMTTMVMWGSDPTYRTYPRFFWVSSADLKTWSDVVWAEPYGIDPHLWQDPNTGKNYLSVMGLDDNRERLWGISQCEVDLDSGNCVGPYRRTWNGTLPIDPSARPEGPKLFYKEPYYYMIAAEGGTGEGHRATIARSDGPEGPWENSPTNPLIYNGADPSLTVQNTGHATFADTPDGRWFATFLARRWVGGDNPIGRETYFAPVTWRDDGWPLMNDGEPILLSQEYDYGPNQEYPPAPWEDKFEGTELDNSWYQLRSPYTKNFYLNSGNRRQGMGINQTSGLTFVPNVFTLGERDTPAAILRKQKSFNMTFSATLLPTDVSLGQKQSVGISMYSSEGTHQDLVVRGCVNETESVQCIRVDSAVRLPGPEGSPTNWPTSKEFPFPYDVIPKGLTFHIRAQQTGYRLGWGLGCGNVTWVHEFPLRDLPVGFDGAMFALFASSNGLPWPLDGPQVGFSKVREEYFDENLADYQDLD